jgi:hypothetical protein
MVRKDCSSTGLAQSDEWLSKWAAHDSKVVLQSRSNFQRSATEPEENIMAKKAKKKAKKAGKKKASKKARR